MVGTLYDTDGQTVLEENHFNSWNSQLWRRVRNTFSVDLENMYKTLRSNGLFTLENMLTYFDAVTDIISPKMYNDSQQIKYLSIFSRVNNPFERRVLYIFSKSTLNVFLTLLHSCEFHELKWFSSKIVCPSVS